MLDVGNQAPSFSLQSIRGSRLSFEGRVRSRPLLLVFLETDCPTCRLTIPYLNRLWRELGEMVDVIALSQDSEAPTRELIEQTQIEFPISVDSDLSITKLYDPIAVPTLFLISTEGRILRTLNGFDKRGLNDIATAIADAPFVIAEPYDGAPETKFGCTSRHLEPNTDGELASAANPYQ
jgi:peroxiredoxin